VTTDTIGDTSANGNYINGRMDVCPITATDSGTLSSVGINVLTASGNVRVCIYSTRTTTASGLLGQSASTPVVTGWMDLEITGVSIVQGTTYYLGVQFDDNTAYNYLQWSGTSYYVAMVYGTFPDPSGTLSSAGFTDNMRMTYSVSSGVTKKNYVFSRGRRNFRFHSGVIRR
jgi:hypothetical protein